MIYNRCGKSGLQLPALSLGLMTVFKGDTENARAIVRRAYEAGITHFDLAYGYGGRDKISAEEYFGQLLKKDLAGHRDKLIISSKAADGSRKHLVSKLDASLQRLGVDYVDIFYHHVPDPETPMEETAAALDHVVRQGKALYIGLSNYSAAETETAVRWLAERGARCVVHQPNYNLLARWIEQDLLGVLEREGIGCVTFNPLAAGLLTNKFSNGLNAASRAHGYLDAIRASAKAGDGTFGFIKTQNVDQELSGKIHQLREIAARRGQSLAQLALAWTIRRPPVTSALFGASTLEQLEENLGALENTKFDKAELTEITAIVS